MRIWRFLLRRLFQVGISFFIILSLLFFLLRLSPGDPYSKYIDSDMTTQEVEIIKSQMGLDRPLWAQYLIYLKNFIKGDMGISFYYGKPVGEVIRGKVFNTILLFTTSVIFSALVGIFLGKIAAWKRGSLLDSFLTFSSLVTHTLFLPWLGLLLIWLLGYKLELFPLSSMYTPEIWLDPEISFLRKLLDVLHHMFLPFLTLFLLHFGSYLLLMRNSMIGVLKEDYILTAKAKGLEDKDIINKHAVPNASLPVITSVGLSLAFSINGGALTETVFSWPGLGRELVVAVSQNDYPLAQAAFLLIAIVVLLANLLVDLLYAYLDPRIRYE